MQTILVIDDDESLRDTIGVMLEQEGFRTVLVGDGRTGYEKAVTLKPDLMLVDLRLPGMNGTDICKQLRAAHVKTPIIVLSAVGDELDKVRSEEHTSELQSLRHLVCRLLLEKKKN